MCGGCCGCVLTGPERWRLLLSPHLRQSDVTISRLTRQVAPGSASTCILREAWSDHKTEEERIPYEFRLSLNWARFFPGRWCEHRLNMGSQWWTCAAPHLTRNLLLIVPINILTVTLFNSTQVNIMLVQGVRRYGIGPSLCPPQI